MTVSLSGAMYVLSFLCGGAYLFLGLAAYGKANNGNTHDKYGAASPWWAFYGDVYDETGKQFCRWGKVSFVAAMLFVAVGYLAEQAAI